MERNIRLVILLGVFLAFIVVFSPIVFALSNDQTARPENSNESTKVLTGVYVLNIGNLDVDTGSYTIDFYLNQISDKPYSIDSLEFMNGYTSKAVKEYNHPHEKTYRVQAGLSTNVDLRNYPFDEHQLPIDIEDKLNTTRSIIYVFDAKIAVLIPTRL